MFDSLHSERVFPCVQIEFLCFNLCTLPLVLSLGTTEKSLSPSSSFLLARYLYTLMRFLLSLLFSRLNSPCSPRDFSYDKCCSPLIIFMALHWTLSCTRKPRTGCGAQMWPHQFWEEKKDHLTWPAGNAPPNAAQDDAGLLCCKGTLLAFWPAWC